MQIYNLPECATDNTFEGVQFVFPEEEIYNLTLANAKIQVRAAVGTPILKEFKISDGSLLIQGTNVISIPPQLIKLKSGTYSWDLKIIFLDQREKTFIGGKWVITPVITSL